MPCMPENPRDKRKKMSRRVEMGGVFSRCLNSAKVMAVFGDNLALLTSTVSLR